MITTHTEHPLFVPHGDAHIAAVLTVPNCGARGVVLLLQGLNASRSHRNRLWTRTARSLATHGIASVRMDYPEIGDSTGALRPDLETPPVEEVMAVARLACDIVGTEGLAVIGNCFGARAGFLLAARMEACKTIAVILHNSAKPLARGQGMAGWISRTVQRIPMHRMPRLLRIARRVLPRVRVLPKLLPEVETFLRSKGGLTLFLGAPEVTDRFRDAVMPLVSTGDRAAAPLEVRPIATSLGLRSPPPIQDLIIESVVEWMDHAFPASDSDLGLGSRPAPHGGIP